MLAASLEWPLALRMALRVSTREDLTAGSESFGHAPSHAHVLCQQVLTFHEQGNRVFLG